ncbi:hypothetical protein DEDGFLLK_00087 [Lactiplantibacillus phage Gut-P1]|nr:hypothetical protein DEDGFLLK_00087 [Lactiplantibacillus phage Gut-P1]
MEGNNHKLKIYKRGKTIYAENITGINPDVGLIIIGGNNNNEHAKKENIKDEKD